MRVSRKISWNPRRNELTLRNAKLRLLGKKQRLLEVNFSVQRRESASRSMQLGPSSQRQRSRRHEFGYSKISFLPNGHVARFLTRGPRTRLMRTRHLFSEPLNSLNSQWPCPNPTLLTWKRRRHEVLRPFLCRALHEVAFQRNLRILRQPVRKKCGVSDFCSLFSKTP